MLLFWLPLEEKDLRSADWMRGKRTPFAFPLEALEMSVCPVGTTPKACANGSGERNEDLARQCQRRRLSDREKVARRAG